MIIFFYNFHLSSLFVLWKFVIIVFYHQKINLGPYLPINKAIAVVNSHNFLELLKLYKTRLNHNL